VLLGYVTLARADGSAGKTSPTAIASTPAGPAAAAVGGRALAPFAIADFDGDSQPDLASVQVGQIQDSRTRYWIHFQLSGGARTAIGLTAPSGGLHLSPRDVNGDDFPDLIVTATWLQRPVAVLLNDGHGNFTVNDPARFPECMRESQRNWGASAVQVKDTAAAILTRSFAGNCEARSWTFVLRRGSELLAFCDTSVRVSSVTTSFLGRAPPSLPAHV
jgi:hypothetical protein